MERRLKGGVDEMKENDGGKICGLTSGRQFMIKTLLLLWPFDSE